MKIKITVLLIIHFLHLGSAADTPPKIIAVTCTPAPEGSPRLSPAQERRGTYSYKIVKSYPHDPQAFTQGLVYHGGFLYESTGQYGRSSLRQVDLTTGSILKIHNLSPFFFGEGLTIFKEKLIQLTYRSRIGFVYDLHSFERTGRFDYQTQGWGLTHDGARLIMSDGSARIRYIDPGTYTAQGSVTVTDNGRPVDKLNELEYIEGALYANVYQTNTIVLINPETGEVNGRIDLSGLLQGYDYDGRVDVLNGIAYDSIQKRIFVTGKLWPRLFEIELIPTNPSRFNIE